MPSERRKTTRELLLSIECRWVRSWLVSLQQQFGHSLGVASRERVAAVVDPPLSAPFGVYSLCCYLFLYCLLLCCLPSFMAASIKNLQPSSCFGCFRIQPMEKLRHPNLAPDAFKECAWREKDLGGKWNSSSCRAEDDYCKNRIYQIIQVDLEVLYVL